MFEKIVDGILVAIFIALVSWFAYIGYQETERLIEEGFAEAERLLQEEREWEKANPITHLAPFPAKGIERKPFVIGPPPPLPNPTRQPR